MPDRRVAWAILIGLVGFVAVLATAGSASIAWDEAIYMRSARRYMAWVDILRRSPSVALDKATLTEYWGMAAPGRPSAGRVEDIHPPLMKLAAGVSWRIWRGISGDLVAFRSVSALLFGVLLGALFHWLSEAAGTVAGLAAVLCLGLMPRFFAHAHLVALDAPLATLALLATYVYWRTVDRPGLRWAVPFGLLWGLALGVKNGGWLLPIGLVVWTLVYYRTWRHCARLALAAVIAVLVFVASWPWLYHDTPARLSEFFGFAFFGHANLLSQHTYYLGQIYEKPPWHYPLVIAVAVVPLTILALIVVGMVWAGDRAERQATGSAQAPPRVQRLHTLLLLSALGPMLPFLLGLVAAYDGERLFLSSFPFLVALGGLGFARVQAMIWGLFWRYQPRLAARRHNLRLRSVITVALFLVVFAWPLAAIVRLHPYELAYYSELVGGITGARRLGLETTFWGDSYQGVLAYLNEKAETRATVWADAYQVLWAYQDVGRLRQDIFVPGADTPDPTAADLAVVQARQSRYFPAVASLIQNRRPEFVIGVDGVPLVMVYRIR